MKKLYPLRFLILAAALPGSCQPRGKDTAKHVKVYDEPGRFGGWPANNGIWSWDDEILAGFTQGFYKYLGPGSEIKNKRCIS